MKIKWEESDFKQGTKFRLPRYPNLTMLVGGYLTNTKRPQPLIVVSTDGLVAGEFANISEVAAFLSKEAAIPLL